MTKGKRNLLQAGLALLMLSSLSAQNVLAQAYPAKPIRMLVGLAAGGATDTTARLVAQKMGDALGQPVTVENIVGASGQLAGQRLLSAPADGYTLIMVAASAAVHPALSSKIPYDLLRDFAPITLVTIGTYVLVVPTTFKARSVGELIAMAKAQPNKHTYGSDGVGSSLHLSGELLKSMAGIQLVHVPYKGGAAAAAATASGEVDMSFVSINSAIPFLNSGRVIPLAMSHDKRSTLMPNIPTLDESGLKGFDRLGWYGLMTKAGVPRDTIMKVHSAVVNATNTAEIKSVLQKQGLEPATNTPEEFAAFIRKELDINAKLVKAAGIKTE
jgi:tripartite-type tricarboxylate transporter receptor subunit TctC